MLRAGSLFDPAQLTSLAKRRVVPSSHSKELYELSNSKYKKIHRFSRGHHNDLVIQDGYFEILHEFLLQREIVI